MKPITEFIIMKIFMKIVKICPKSPRFTVLVFKLDGTILELSVHFTHITQVLYYIICKK